MTVLFCPAWDISLIWRRHRCRRRTAKLRPMSHAYSLWKGREVYRATTAVTLFVRFCGLYEGPPNLLAFNVKQCVLRTRIRRDSLCRFNDTWPLQITLKKDLEPFPVREEMRILGRQTQTDDQIYLQNKTLEFRSCNFTMDIWIQV